MEVGHSPRVGGGSGGAVQGVVGGSRNVELGAFINPLEILADSDDSSDSDFDSPESFSRSRSDTRRHFSSHSNPQSRSHSPSFDASSSAHLLPRHYRRGSLTLNSRSLRGPKHRRRSKLATWDLEWFRQRATMLTMAISLLLLAFYGVVYGGPIRRQAGAATTSPPWYPSRKFPLDSAGIAGGR